MITCAVSDIFDIRYGHSLELNALTQTPPGKGVPFVSRKTGSNGISAFVKPIQGVEPAPAGEITCALGGAVLMTYVQELPFYAGRDVAILKPKKAMTKAEILFYCLCIRSNRYRYNYGRQANKTLAGLKVPSAEAIPTWVNASNLEPFEGVSLANSEIGPEPLNSSEWKNFRYDEIFEIRKGYYNKKPPETGIASNPVPFIGATEYNNGITSYYSLEEISNYSRGGEIENVSTTDKKIFPANAITVANNGASVGFAFYQPSSFTCSHDVNPLYLLNAEMTPEIGLFLCAVIRMDRYRWNYGRKWRPSRMPQSIIKLPITVAGQPDWAFMESYVKALPYSVSL